MRRVLLVATAVLPVACAHAAPPPGRPLAPPIATAPSAAEPPPAVAATAPTWPDALAPAMKGRGDPHAQPIPAAARRTRAGPVARLRRHERRRGRRLAGHTGSGRRDARRGRGAMAGRGARDGRGGRRRAWPTCCSRASACSISRRGSAASGSTRGARPSPFDVVSAGARGRARRRRSRREGGASARRRRRPSAPQWPSWRRCAPPARRRRMLARALAAEGADLGVAWQSTFVQHVARLDGEGAAPSPMADRALAIVRAAVMTQACGIDSVRGLDRHGARRRALRRRGRPLGAPRRSSRTRPRSAATPIGPPREVEASAGDDGDRSAAPFARSRRHADPGRGAAHRRGRDHRGRR